MEDWKRRWADELQNILWASRTTKRTATGETPFSMVYGTEAIIPTELSFPIAKTALTEAGKSRSNEKAKMLDLNLVEERREMAAVKMLAYQQKVAELYNK